MDKFELSDNRERHILLSDAIKALQKLAAAMLEQYPASAQHAISGAIAAGARLEVHVELAPSIQLRGCLVHSVGEIELFAIDSSPRRETAH